MGYYTTGPDYLSGILGLLPEEDPAQIAQPFKSVKPGNPVSPLPGPGFTLPFEPPIPITGNPGGGDNPNSPMNNRPVADYNPNLVGQYVGYNNPEYGMGLTYNNSSNVDPAVEPTGILKHILPGAFIAKGINFLEEKFFPEALKDNVDKLIPEAIKESYGDFMDKYGTEETPQDIDYDFNPKAFNAEQIVGLGSRYGLTGSYADQLKAAQDFTQSTIEKENNLALGLADTANQYTNKLKGFDFLNAPPSLGDLSDYTLSDMNMTNQYNDAIRGQEAREAREAQAEQDRINNAVVSGNNVGTGYNPVTGNYGGLLTNTNRNTNVTSNVKTGPYSGAVINNENYNKMRDAKRQAEAKKGFEQAQTSVAEQAEQNKQRREKNKNQGNNSGNNNSGNNNSGGGSKPGAGAGTGGCFIKGTMIEMADGTEKEITSINVGEETKGGTVEAKLEFMPHNIYDYKGVKVSGSHWVMEDNQFTEVENSKHGVLTDIIEPVYNFITSKHRIFIKGVEFGGFYSQDPNNYEPYFKQEKIKINKELSEKTT